jgi:hypothetical protein
VLTVCDGARQTVSNAEFFSWSNVPTEALLLELNKRDNGQPRPECGSEQGGSYDTAIHVFALFLILGLSCLACAFPLLSRRNTTGRKQRYISTMKIGCDDTEEA